jgi:hypothetical protein
VGKLLGPKGSSLKALQEETGTKMAILGRGSMRDKQKVLLVRTVPCRIMYLWRPTVQSTKGIGYNGSDLSVVWLHCDGVCDLAMQQLLCVCLAVAMSVGSILTCSTTSAHVCDTGHQTSSVLLYHHTRLALAALTKCTVRSDWTMDIVHSHDGIRGDLDV